MFTNRNTVWNLAFEVWSGASISQAEGCQGQASFALAIRHQLRDRFQLLDHIPETRSTHMYRNVVRNRVELNSILSPSGIIWNI